MPLLGMDSVRRYFPHRWPLACKLSCSRLPVLEAGIYPLGWTNSLRARCIEVFAVDALSFTNAIWQAQLELFSPP